MIAEQIPVGLPLGLTGSPLRGVVDQHLKGERPIPVASAENSGEKPTVNWLYALDCVAQLFGNPELHARRSGAFRLERPGRPHCVLSRSELLVASEPPFLDAYDVQLFSCKRRA